MRILGVDPGLTRCGVGVIDARANRTVNLVDVRVIQTSTALELPQRLLELRSQLGSI
ncbi:MAG: hypothetical protein RIR88_823, partial [Actinomycetota bacterium]